ncbi:hypothetical protein N0V93_007993 [Gnomoniopsis smithogilvyi]|uniref:FAD-binding domain-containing protein n=1 Tax=Gnomoniopsis smithogilvyi TaxID=1191159 RepID=A0A9W8YPG6_9PEZI|nr:hypothetical protein N0V93_007993 [Gnomoniopsis smithogilvyi]
MAKSSYPHILIVGAGLSGLTLAQILRKNGISYEVFERDVDVNARTQGWAIALHGPVLRDLKECLPEDIGPIEQTNHLIPLDLQAQFVFYDKNRPGLRVGVNDNETGQIVRANRQRLRDYLRRFIPVQYDKRVVRVEEADGKVTVFFEKGGSATGDVVVGAEGTQSAVRKHILHNKDVMKGLPTGSLVGEVELTGDDFKQQLELGHSAYIVLTRAENHAVIFAALNKVSPDGKKGYYYFLLHWFDEQAAHSAPDNPYWTLTATKEELAVFAREHTKLLPERLRSLVDKVPVEGYKTPGITLRSVELTPEQLPPGRVTLMGDAAHSMTPFRGEAGVCALQDAVNLGRTLTHIANAQLKGPDFLAVMTKYRDDMLTRGAEAAERSGSISKTQNITCGKVGVPLPEETINI